MGNETHSTETLSVTMEIKKQFHPYEFKKRGEFSCCEIPGCTKFHNEFGVPYANYDVQATFMPAPEAETCETVSTPGCANPKAVNFDPTAETSLPECYVSS